MEKHANRQLILGGIDEDGIVGVYADGAALPVGVCYNAEKRVVVLPCKVGDRVWCNDDYWGDLCKGHISAIRLVGEHCTPVFDCLFYSSLVNSEFIRKNCLAPTIGSVYFRTEAEAQAALERMKR